MNDQPKRAALYLRVSTDKQTTANQRMELEKVAAARGWTLAADAIYEDAGISGAKGRDKRPGLDRMLKDATAGRFDVLMAWSVDRIGRSMLHVAQTMTELASLGRELYLHQQAIDSSTPAGKAMVQMAAVFAELERSMIVERVNAGIRRAKRHGTKSGKAIGRPRMSEATLATIRRERDRGTPVRKIAADLGVGTGTVGRALGYGQAARHK
jgi:DNA invertase Pin-like site-specific DNA recombinase